MTIKLQVKEKITNLTTYKSFWLYADLGYAKKTISYIPSDVAELLGISLVELHSIEEGVYIAGYTTGVDK